MFMIVHVVCILCIHVRVYETSGLSQVEQNALTKQHNDYRRSVKSSDMEEMTWSDPLSNLALTLAQTCQFKHGNTDTSKLGLGFNSAGQNLYQTTAATLNVTSAVESWYAEKTHYDIGTHKCSGVCGHYTQIVWASSKLVGCAFHKCPDGNHFVCNYGPPGNYAGAKPYKQGLACSQCHSGKYTCSDELCTNCQSGTSGCGCKADCKNCGTITGSCTCLCKKGWRGVECSDECKDTDSRCGSGWFKSSCSGNEYSNTIRQKCPLLCGQCEKADQQEIICRTEKPVSKSTLPNQTIWILGLILMQFRMM